MASGKNVVGWFEIPVRDMDRAIEFYGSVLMVTLERHMLGPLDMAWFPYVDNAPGSGGSLVCNKEYKPSAEGVLIYFTTPTGDLDGDLSRVEKAGGKVLRKKALIAEGFGYMGLFIDTEGNRIAMHSRV